MDQLFRHCERLQGAWQSRKNNKKCYKSAFFSWIAYVQLLRNFLSSDGKTDPCNKAGQAPIAEAE